MQWLFNKKKMWFVVLPLVVFMTGCGSKGGDNDGGNPDTTAPTVSSTVPADAATGIAVNANITATFSEAMDAATVITAFTLTNGATPVSGAVTYADTVATLNPADDLAVSTTYTATITTGAQDMAGNALVANKTWSFTTRATTAAGPAPVNLRTAGNFVILTESGITNVPTSAITGNIGSSPITAAAMDNVTCSEITGTIYGVDAAYTGDGIDVTCFAGTADDKTLVDNAVLDMGTAYNDAAGRTSPDFTEHGAAGEIGGLTLVPGLYKWSTDVLISTDVTLNGGPNDVWIFQISGGITQAPGVRVRLDGGALPKNIFWQSFGVVALDTTAHMEGAILAKTAITLKTGATVNGRLLAQTEVTLQGNTVAQPVP